MAKKNTETETPPAEAPENSTEPADEARDTSVDSDEIEEILTQEEAVEILQFDPFAEKKGKDEPAAEKTPKEKTPKEKTPKETPAAIPEESQTPQTPKADEGKPPIPAPVPVTPAADDSSNALMLQQIAGLTQRLAVTEKALAQQPQAQQPQAGQVPSGAPAQPGFDFVVPDNLVAALSSEDPADVKQGINGLLQGIGQAVHRTVMAEVNQIVEQERAAMSTSVNDAQEMRTLQADFYKTFPELDNPALKPMVGNIAKQVMAQLGVTQWSPEVRDAVGNQVRSVLSGVVPGATTPVTPTPPVVVPAADPPILTGGAVRPGGGPAPSGNALERDVAETLFGP